MEQHQRCIGPDFEVELRHRVLNTAARGKVRAILPKEVEDLMDAAIRQEIADAMAEKVGTLKRKPWSGKVNEVTIQPEFKSFIEGYVDQAVANAVKPDWLTQEYLDERLEAALKEIKDTAIRRFEHNLRYEMANAVAKLVGEKVAKLMQTDVAEAVGS